MGNLVGFKFKSQRFACRMQFLTLTVLLGSASAFASPFAQQLGMTKLHLRRNANSNVKFRGGSSESELFSTADPSSSSLETEILDASILPSTPASGGTMTLTASTFNLMKACLGAGLLSLPSGVAAFGDSPRALIPATAIFTFLGFLSSYSFYTIGKLCQQTESSSMAEAWTKIVGKDSSWLISLCCFITPLGAALAYSIILGDVFSNLAKTVGLTGVLAAREASILLVTSGLLYPLCMLKNLSALAPVSVIGIGGVLVTAAFMAVRMLGFANPATAKVLSAAVASPKVSERALRETSSDESRELATYSRLHLLLN